MFMYKYSRAGIEGGFIINNPERLDNEGNQIYLRKEIKIALPGKKFILRCNGTTLCLCFEEELSSGDKFILDEVVDNHIQNK